MKEHYQVIIVGGGQAGLSVAHGLQENGIDYVIFEQDEIASSWKKKRWDSFCLVTPNFQCRLPGYSYSGPEPEGFMMKDDIVKFVKDYAKSFDPPIKEGVKVLEVSKDYSTHLYHVSTSIGDYSADQVVIAAGNFHSPKFPAITQKMTENITHLHSSEYKNPSELPEGQVLVVGSGQSGCQIAEDLHLAGRKVHLCIGQAPRSPRVYRGKDVVTWLEELGYYDYTIDTHPDGEQVRGKINHYVSGRDGGREIDLRAFALEGMKIYGFLKDIEGTKMILGDNLKKDLDKADKSYVGIKARIDQYIADQGIDAPKEDSSYSPVWEPNEVISSIDYKKENITSAIWCIGWNFDFSWIKSPIFDAKGYPNYYRGVTHEEGLYFIGLAWMYTWGSGRFSAVKQDAEYLTAYILNKIHSKELTNKQA